MTQIISMNGIADPASSFGSSTMQDFTNVLGEWWLGGTLAASMINQITGVSGTAFGSPTVAAGYMDTVSGASGSQKGFITDILTPNNLTVVALVRRTSGSPTHIGSNDANWAVQTVSGKIGMNNGASVVNTDQAQVVPETPPLFTFVMGVSMLSGLSKIYKVTQSGTTVDEAGSLQYVVATRTASLIRIGGQNDVNSAGAGEIAAAAVIADLKNQAYAEAMYALWKPYAEARGITVA